MTDTEVSVHRRFMTSPTRYCSVGRVLSRGLRAAGCFPPLITELLEWSGGQMDAFYASMDLMGEGHVSWASDGPVPIWFDIAQDLTVRWMQMQMREAVAQPGDYAAQYLSAVLRTFVWALPHQYRVDASAGTRVQVDLAGGGLDSGQRRVVTLVAR